jgi:hypothetical protein
MKLAMLLSKRKIKQAINVGIQEQLTLLFLYFLALELIHEQLK